MKITFDDQTLELTPAGSGKSYRAVMGDKSVEVEIGRVQSGQLELLIDGQRVMDSTKASVSPFYYGPVPLDVTYKEPSAYGSTGAIFQQGIGFVHPPLSVGTHTITLVSESFVPPDGTFLNLTLYPEGAGAHYENTWTITVAPNP